MRRGTFTPARLAFERPIATACFLERIGCFPSFARCISSLTNSPACVVGAFPSRLAFLARFTVVFEGIFSLRKVPEGQRENPLPPLPGFYFCLRGNRRIDRRFSERAQCRKDRHGYSRDHLVPGGSRIHLETRLFSAKTAESVHKTQEGSSKGSGLNWGKVEFRSRLVRSGKSSWLNPGTPATSGPVPRGMAPIHLPGREPMKAVFGGQIPGTA